MSFYILFVISAFAVLQGVLSARGGWSFLRFVRRALREPPPPWTPFVTVVLPCKGVDNRLIETLAGAIAQDYPTYELICAVESDDDPAYALIQEAQRTTARVPMRCVVAGLSQHCAQKITNHLAALAVADPRSEVFVFLDSDAVPHRSWLAALVAPLADQQVGAATGYRWYVPTGSWPSLVRCVWNASALTFLGDHRFNFCWGGSTAMRRETFAQLRIAERWANALSEDYLMTRSVNAAGLRIRFVPQCVLPSDEDASWSFISRFARRQLVITRVCHAKFWSVAMGMAVQFNAGFWGWLLWLPLAGGAAPPWQRTTAIAVPALLYGLAIVKSVLRDRAVSLILPDPAVRRGVFALDALGSPIIGLMHLLLLLSSATSNRFWWRGVLYQMIDVDRTRIVARQSEAPTNSQGREDTLTPPVHWPAPAVDEREPAAK